ncbi:MAG: DUF1592 domain-containing protein [Vicinamibacterales bacterium]
MRVSCLVLAAFVLGSATPMAAAQPSSPRPGSSGAAANRGAVVTRYCVGCHNDRLKTAGLSLEAIDVTDASRSATIWEKVIAKLRAGAMPPAGRPRPDRITQDAFVSGLEAELDAAAAAHPNPGRPTLHRLNRSEYGHAIRDLLALDVDVSGLLPANDAAYGFDNNADVLTLSPGLLERYMSAARKISRLAVGDPRMRPTTDSYQVSALLNQDAQMDDELPFGSRGGLAVRHHFPLDGEYQLQVRLQRVQATGAIKGITAEPQEIEVRVDRQLVTTFKVASVFPTNGRPTPQYSDDALVVRFPARAGTRLVTVSLLKGPAAVEGLGPTHLPVWTFSPGRAIERMGIDRVSIEGPHGATGPGDTPSRDGVFVCRPQNAAAEDSCARTILGRLARRAFRRPIAAGDVDRLLEFYRPSRAEHGFDAGIQAALESILIDPEFLFRVEREDSATSAARLRRLSDVELASRLSFFVWSSIPDDELLDAAEGGRLREPAELERQVRRMLADPRARALVTDFGAQWLHLRNMRAVAPFVNAFPEFDDNLREAFVRETELFLDSQIREDHALADLLTANYTFVNERLARHYGIPNVLGSRFRRVTLEGDHRAGLLGHGSVLAVTSYSTRTSPVIRGKWVLENLLGAPPPPPPPNVPALPDTGKGGQPASVRERLQQHRANPVCATCHSRMDPLGFALENFDAIGRWRGTGEDGAPIDASATMPDGTAFNGPAELRRLLAARSDEFARTVTSKLLTYALGRGLEADDMPAVRAILRDAAPGGYRWSAIVLGIVKSVPFQMRRSDS